MPSSLVDAFSSFVSEEIVALSFISEDCSLSKLLSESLCSTSCSSAVVASASLSASLLPNFNLACLLAFFSSSNLSVVSNASNSRRSISSLRASLSAISFSDIASNESGMIASSSSFITTSPTAFFGGSKTPSMIPSIINSSSGITLLSVAFSISSAATFVPTAPPITSVAFLTLSFTVVATDFT